LTLRRFARRLGRMTRATAFASIACAARRAGAASRALGRMSHGAAATMRKAHVVGIPSRSPGPGRS